MTDDNSRSYLVALSREERSSGQWVSEREVIALTGLSSRALVGRRARKSIVARPARTTKVGGRDWWYWHTDVDELRSHKVAVPAPSPHPPEPLSLLRTELDMAQSEARVYEVEALRSRLEGVIERQHQQIDELTRQVTSLRGALDALLSAFPAKS